MGRSPSPSSSDGEPRNRRRRHSDSDSDSEGHGRATARRRMNPPADSSAPPPPPAGPAPGEKVQTELSVEATNKLREKLGLKPLHAPPPPPEEEKAKVHEELSVAATNKLRAELGLKPLHGSAGPADAAAPEPAPAGEGEQTFHGEMSIEATNEMRRKLGLKPLYTDEPKEAKRETEMLNGQAVEVSRTAANEIFMPEKVASEVSKITAGLKLDKRIGIGHVRAEGDWDEAYLKNSKRGGVGGINADALSASTLRLMGGSDEVVAADFKKRVWNTHLSIAATDKLRKAAGLAPLHPLPGR